MTIPRLDYFQFLFNNGRGIRTTQIDWAVTDAALTALLSSLTGSGNTVLFTNQADSADFPTANIENGTYMVQFNSGSIDVIKVWLRAGTPSAWQDAGLPTLALGAASVYLAMRDVLRGANGIAIDQDAANNRLTARFTGGPTANPNTVPTVPLRRITIDGTTYDTRWGNATFLGTTAVYDEANNLLMVDISADAYGSISLGDGVLFQLPDTLSNKTDDLDLQVESDGVFERRGLQDSHGTPVNAAELRGGTTVDAVLVVPDGTTRKWRMIEPPVDLTQAQVQDATSTIFGAISGQRVSQAVSVFGSVTHIVDAAPTATLGKSGDRAIAKLSETQVAGYTRSGNTWTQEWTFNAGMVGPGRTLEQLQDAVALMFAGSQVTYDDTAGTIAINFPTGGNPTIPFGVFREISGSPDRVGLWRIGDGETDGTDGDTHTIGGWLHGGSSGWTISSAGVVDFKDILDGFNDLYFLRREGDTLPFSRITGKDYDDLSDKPVHNIANDASLPDADADTLGVSYRTRDRGHTWTGTEEVIAGVDRVLNFTQFPADTTSTSGFRYQGSAGSRADLPDAPTVADEGKWWLRRDWLLQNVAPFALIDSEGNYQSIAHSPETDHPYIGAWDAQGSAQGSHEFTAAGQLAAFPDANGVYQLFSVNADFVAGTPTTHHYHFTRSDVSDLLLSRVDNLEAGVLASETLHDSTGGTRAGASFTWANNLNFELSRALTANDDGKRLMVDITFDIGTSPNQQSWNHTFNMDAKRFREMAVHTATTGTAFPDAYYTYGIGRMSGGSGRDARVARNRTAGGADIIRWFVAGSGNDQNMANIAATVKLTPF